MYVRRQLCPAAGNSYRDVKCWRCRAQVSEALRLPGYCSRRTPAPQRGSPVSFDLTPKRPHSTPKAKAVIQLMQNGGPSQMDLVDPKPVLTKLNGKKHSEKLETLQEGSAENVLMGSPYKFERRGQCGMDISELLPHTATIVG